jgi:flagellar basal-body rod protein FlgB
MDPLLNTVEYTLGGLQLRLDTVANNIANANSPLYRSQKVNFEQNLANALRAGKAAPSESPTLAGGTDLVDKTGNSVSIENELTEMTKSSLERQVMVSGFNYKIDLLKAAGGVGR